MKKLFIGLFIAAAGVTAFVLLRPSSDTSSKYQALLAGEWRLDSIERNTDSTLHPAVDGILKAVDSLLMNCRFSFGNDSLFSLTSNDSSAINGSGRFAWSSDKEISLTGKDFTDSTERYAVQQLSRDYLVLLSSDSTALYFKRVSATKK